MTVTAGDLSRAVSHALRHEPWLYELELDERGWAHIDQLLNALRGKGGVWASVDLESLESMIASSTKRRHEIKGDRIRALYGHSSSIVIKKTPARPPPLLFHGTSPHGWHIIRDKGLRPMGRQYVHLSTDVATATAVGRRKSPDPVIVSVDANRAAEMGVSFYEGNEMVWLADCIPPAFIEHADGR